MTNDDRKFPIASQQEVAEVRAHPKKGRETIVLGTPMRGTYYQTKCGVCSEIGFGSSPLKSQIALAEFACLSIEKDWNEWLHRRST